MSLSQEILFEEKQGVKAQSKDETDSYNSVPSIANMIEKNLKPFLTFSRTKNLNSLQSEFISHRVFICIVYLDVKLDI